MSAVSLPAPIANDAKSSERAAESAAIRTVPAGSLYWALINPASLGAVSARHLRQMASERSPALAEMFGASLPRPLEEVQTVFAVQPDGRVVGCSIPLDRLDEFNSPELLVLCPDRLPEALSAITGGPIDPRVLNFLVGPHEPLPVRTARRRLGLAACAAVALTGIVLLVGIERRASEVRREQQAVLAASDGLLRQVVARSVDIEHGAALVESELARLQQTRMRASSAGNDAAQSLASFLAAWPRGEDAPRVRTEGVTVTGDMISLSMVADDRTAAGKIADALRNARGWTLMQPQMSAADDKTGSVRLQLRLVKEEPTGSAEVQP